MPQGLPLQTSSSNNDSDGGYVHDDDFIFGEGCV